MSTKEEKINLLTEIIEDLQASTETGHWIHHEETVDHAEHWKCSKCYRSTMTNPFPVNGNDYNAMYYCPKCGIKMDNNKGVLEQLAERQKSLLDSVREWNDAIRRSKNGYIN